MAVTKVKTWVSLCTLSAPLFIIAFPSGGNVNPISLHIRVADQTPACPRSKHCSINPKRESSRGKLSLRGSLGTSSFGF